MSGSGISWAICKSASRSRQKTMPAPHHSVFLRARCPSCRPTNSVKALKGFKALTTLVHQYQKSKTILDFNEATDDKVLEGQWHWPYYMQTICTSLQTDNHANTSSLNFMGQTLFWHPTNSDKALKLNNEKQKSIQPTAEHDIWQLRQKVLSNIDETQQ